MTRVLGTVEKAGEILALFTAQEPEWGATDVARRLGLPKTTAQSQLQSLDRIGLLRRAGRSRYRLGWRVVGMGRTVLETSSLRAHSARASAELALRMKATAHVAALDGRAVTFLSKARPKGCPVAVPTGVGLRVAAQATAAGKALLAELPDDEVRDLMAGIGWEPFTDRTVRSIDELLPALERVRATGVAIGDEEFVTGVRCLATVIRDERDEAVAALSLSFPVGRPIAADAPASVCRVAASITRSLREAATSAVAR